MKESKQTSAIPNIPKCSCGGEHKVLSKERREWNTATGYKIQCTECGIIRGWVEYDS